MDVLSTLKTIYNWNNYRNIFDTVSSCRKEIVSYNITVSMFVKHD